MEFKRCGRCGCFFVSEDDVCCNCKTKDRADTIKLQNFIEEHDTISSIEEISENTGITINNLSRLGEVTNVDEKSGNIRFTPFIKIEL